MADVFDEIDDIPPYTPQTKRPKIKVGTHELSVLAMYSKQTQDSGNIIVIEARVDKSTTMPIGTEVEHAFFFNGQKDWQRKRDKGRWVAYLRALVPSKQPSEVMAKLVHRHDAEGATPARNASRGWKLEAVGTEVDGFVEVSWSAVTQTNEDIKANRVRLDAAPPPPAPEPERKPEPKAEAKPKTGKAETIDSMLDDLPF